MGSTLKTFILSCFSTESKVTLNRRLCYIKIRKLVNIYKDMETGNLFLSFMDDDMRTARYSSATFQKCLDLFRVSITIHSLVPYRSWSSSCS